MIESLKHIQKKPTTLDNIHESCFRSYSILEYVLEMVNREDSKETIFQVVELLREYPIDTERKTVPPISEYKGDILNNKK